MDVFPAGEVAGEPGRQFEQRRHFSVQAHRALIRNEHARDQFQERGFPGTVTAHHTYGFPVRDVEADIAQGPEVPAMGASSQAVEQKFAHPQVAPAPLVEADPQPAHRNHHSSLSTAGSSLRNVHTPATRTRSVTTMVGMRTGAEGHSLGNHAAWCNWKMPT